MLTQEQKQQIYRWWHVFKNDHELVEIRCVGNKGTFSGYYKNIENLIRDVNLHDDCNVYFTVNDINDACHGRPQCEQMIHSPKNTTNDEEIIGRSFIYIDFDSAKGWTDGKKNGISNVNSTDEEKELAHQKALEVYRYLKGEGFNEPIINDSANGFHAYYPCLLSATEENDKLVERFMKSLSMMFSDENVVVDTTATNRARISKLPGTFSRKGSALSVDRPQRMCKILKVPSELKPIPKEYFQKIADLYPEEEIKPTRENNYSTSKFDLYDFLQRNNISYYKTVKTPIGTRYLLDQCPFDSSHVHGDAMVFQHNGGGLQFSCFHNSCSQYHWREFRLHFEPDAYDKKDYRDYEFKRQHNMMKYQVKEPPQPLKEDNEKGPIWLKMSEIKRPKFNIANYIPSGIEQVDRLTVGFRRKHVTVWSGYRGSAKTTVLNMLILNAAQRGYKTALWTGELDGEEEKNWLYLQAAGKTYNRMTSVQDFYETPDDICEKIDPWIDGHMRIFNNKYGSDFQQIIDKVRELKKEWDLDVAIFDNLMTLDIDGLEGDKNERQKKLMIVLTDLAKENDMHIHIVAHPNKSGNFLRMNNISGTGNIPDLAQNVMILHRINQDFVMNAREFLPNSTIQEILDSKCTNCIEICKWRDKGSAVDHFIKLYFERESNRLKNSPADNVHYNWEEHCEEYSVPEEPQPLPTTIQPNQSFDTPIEPLYTQKEDDAYWGQFRNDTDNCPF